MTVVLHPAGTKDVPAGEALTVPIGPGQDLPDLTHAAESGTLLLFTVEGNVATGDPTGDGYALADTLDSLDLNRKPIPPLAIHLDPDAARENIATAMSYLTTWADAVAARGYAPWLWTSPDLIWEAAKNGAHFSGVYAIAFKPIDADAGAPVPDPRDVPGLPADTYTGARAYAYGSNGETVVDDGVLATAVTPDPEPAPAETAGGQPAPVPSVSLEDHAQLRDELTAVRDQLAELEAKQAADAAAHAEQLQALQDYLDGELSRLAGVDETSDQPATSTGKAGGKS